jgi:hypothetical protein
VADGAYIERRSLPLANGGEVSITQDLISKDEIFGEGFSYDIFSTYWEAIHGRRLLRISPDTINEIIRKIPNSKENLDYLIFQKFRKMDYISVIRSGHLSSEDRVRYRFNFLVQRLGKIMDERGSSKIEVSMPFNGRKIPMGNYSDYGVLKKFKYEDLGDITSLSRESISRVLHHMCFNLNEKNFKIRFSKSGYTYDYKDLLNKEGQDIN